MSYYYTKKADQSIYALYKGDDYIMDGTLDEIAEETGKSKRNLKRYTWKSYNAWVESLDDLSERYSDKRLALVLVKSDKNNRKNYQYSAVIPETIYKPIIKYSKEKKLTRNQVILQCIEYALEHKDENFFSEIFRDNKERE